MTDDNIIEQLLYPLKAETNKSMRILKTEFREILKYDPLVKETDDNQKYLLARSILRKQYKPKEEIKPERKIAIIPEIAYKLIKRHHIKTCDKINSIFVYRNGYYATNHNHNFIKGEIQKVLGENTSKYFVGEIIEYIERETFKNIHDLENKYNYVAIKNGILNLDTFELEPSTPDRFITWKINVEYKPKVGFTTIKKYMDNLVIPDHCDKLQEHIGDILSNHYETKKLMFGIGAQDSGKSTMNNIIQDFLGEDSYCQLNLHQLNEKFTNAEIYCKRLNICSDIPYTLPLRRIGTIKNVTGGDGITIQRKGKDAFKYKPIAKQFFSSNGIPYITDLKDMAFYRRWDFLDFPNEFLPDATIFGRYTTDEMKTELLNYMIDGYKRLKENKWIFTNGDSIDQVMCRFEKVNYIITREGKWLNKNYEANVRCIPEDELWRQMIKEKATSKTFTSFCRWMLNQTIIPVTKSRPVINNIQTPCFSGIQRKVVNNEK